MVADEGDDNGDSWRINSNQDVNDLTISNNVTGSFVDAVTIATDGGVTFNGGIDDAGTISSGTIGDGVAMASSGLTVRNIEQVALASDKTLASSTTLTTEFSPTYTPKFSGSKVLGIATIFLETRHASSAEGRKKLEIAFSGTGITNTTLGFTTKSTIGTYTYDSGGIITTYAFDISGPLLTTTTTDTITADLKLANNENNSVCNYSLYGNNTMSQTHFTWIEYK